MLQEETSSYRSLHVAAGVKFLSHCDILIGKGCAKLSVQGREGTEHCHLIGDRVFIKGLSRELHQFTAKRHQQVEGKRLELNYVH